MTSDITALLPVVLIGPMGSGKTKIGRRVARALDVPFVDTDTRIVDDHGAISLIFEQHGEDRFREIERDVVAAALREQAVVSLGGGAILDQRTRDDLADKTVVFLTVTAEAVMARINSDKRPLLKDGTHVWQRIFDERRDIYESLATTTFDTSHGRISEIAGDVVEWLRWSARTHDIHTNDVHTNDGAPT